MGYDRFESRTPEQVGRDMKRRDKNLAGILPRLQKMSQDLYNAGNINFYIADIQYSDKYGKGPIEDDDLTKDDGDGKLTIYSRFTRSTFLVNTEVFAAPPMLEGGKNTKSNEYAKPRKKALENCRDKNIASILTYIEPGRDYSTDKFWVAFLSRSSIIKMLNNFPDTSHGEECAPAYTVLKKTIQQLR